MLDRRDHRGAARFAHELIEQDRERDAGLGATQADQARHAHCESRGDHAARHPASPCERREHDAGRDETRAAR
jgi:hypothetical protein